MNAGAVDRLNQVLSSEHVPFERLLTGCHRAVERSDVHSLCVQITGLPVLIRIAGNAWYEIVRQALAHLPACPPDIHPALRVDLWDAAETGVQPEDIHADLSAPPTVLKMSEDGRYVGEERHHSTMWMDTQAAHIAGFCRNVTDLTLDERARPFHKLLSIWLTDKGVQFVHAGLISHAGTGLLFVGNGGVGKSTSSIACLRDGMGYLGDDFVGVSSNSGGFLGHGFYASCLLNSDHLLRFPDLSAAAHAPNHAFEHKHVLYLSPRFESALVHTQPIHVIALPRVVNARATSFVPASKASALLAGAPTSVMYLPRPSREAFERLSQLVQAVPSYWLNLGQDIAGIAPAVRDLITQVSAQSNPIQTRPGG